MATLPIPEEQPLLKDGAYDICCVGVTTFGTIPTEFNGVPNAPALHVTWTLEFRDQEWERLGKKTPYTKEHRPFDGWLVYFKKAGAEKQPPYWKALSKWHGRAISDEERRAHDTNAVFGMYGRANIETEYPAGKDPYNKIVSVIPYSGEEWEPKTTPWSFDITKHETLEAAKKAMEAIPAYLHRRIITSSEYLALEAAAK